MDKQEEVVSFRCYDCGCNLEHGVSQVIRIKEYGHRAHWELFCMKDAEMRKGIRDSKGMKI